ncbi:MAG: RNB domain-containing ribonuclease [Coriobacteriales bacterium]|jgi:ribonuclease R|nr:RNB domain-containing ribonuclease [Coriobacteriales bacterium]
MPHRKRKQGRHPTQVSTGRIQVARKGYGFVDTPEGEYFVMRGYLHGAMDGDVVEVVRLRQLEQRRRDIHVQDWKLPRGQRGRDRERLGSVRRVLERAHTTLVGTLIERDGICVIRPHDARIDHDIFLDRRAISKPAADGDVVVVRITTYPSRLEAAMGYIEEVVGHGDEQGIDTEVIIREHGFETVFTAAALEELEAMESDPCSTALLDGVSSASGASGAAGASSASGALSASSASGASGALGALTCRNLPHEAPPHEALSHEAPPHEALLRRDIRDRFVFTIDPADAKDFDDALSVEFIDGQLRLGVHIADVSAYVRWDSALDLNARRRATSVYLPDRVIPMLPPRLSDDLCSLRPDTDRLAFTVDMMMNNDGSVASCEFYPSLIHSAPRLSYEQAQDYLDASEDSPLAAEPIAQNLRVLNRLAHALTRRRKQRGAIDFVGTEAKVTLDEDGKPVAVHLRTRTDATALVEEAMILANEQIASFMLARKASMGTPMKTPMGTSMKTPVGTSMRASMGTAMETPMLYRIHEQPRPSALEELLPTLQEFGYAREGVPQSSTDIQHILDESQGRPEYALVSQLLLRAMKRAIYAPYWTEHYGLASRAYTHFTSPIRRYPDLMVHRLLKLALQLDAIEQADGEARCASRVAVGLSEGTDGESSDELRMSRIRREEAIAQRAMLDEQLREMAAQLVHIAEHSSAQEREAETAAREATALKLAEYLSGRVGERFAALIVGVNSYGLSVREETTLAEGFIDARDLPEDCAYEPERYRWHDSDSNATYRLGAPLNVVLAEVERPNMRLRFVIA